MIIWIDGANGVGKSHVAAKLEELLSNRNAEYIESDLYWVEYLRMAYPSAIRINTEGKSLDEIANEIVTLL